MIKHFPIIFSIITTSIGGIVLANLPKEVVGYKQIQPELCQIEYKELDQTISTVLTPC